jgi:hypothetical protein
MDGSSLLSCGCVRLSSILSKCTIFGTDSRWLLFQEATAPHGPRLLASGLFGGLQQVGCLVFAESGVCCSAIARL